MNHPLAPHQPEPHAQAARRGGRPAAPRAAPWRPPWRGLGAALLGFVCLGGAAPVVLAQAGAAEAPPPWAHAPAWPAEPVLLLGEQHDAAEHQRLAARLVQHLAAHRRLAALLLEMAERGRDTAGLPAHSEEAAVRERLAWNERGWPWQAYGPVVMAAVRAGVPVVGANLPRPRMAEVMAQAQWDDAVPAPAHAQLLRDVREGHCDLMPPQRLPAMVRIQIARDATMAQAILAHLRRDAGQVLLLMAGAEHVARDKGVPVHLQRAQPGLPVRSVAMHAGEPAAGLPFDEVWRTAAFERPDPCIGLRERLRPAAPR